MARSRNAPSVDRPSARGVQFRGQYQWRWQATVRGVYASGVETDEARAIAARKLAIDRMRDGSYVVRKEAESLTLTGAIKRYVAEVRKMKDNEKSRDELDKLSARVIAYLDRQKLGDVSFDRVTKSHMIRYRDARLEDGRSASTVASEMYLISATYETATINWSMDHLRKPTAGRDAQGNRIVPDPKIGRNRSRSRRLTVAEVSALMEAAVPVKELPEILAVGVLTGLRLGQVLALRPDWINFEAGLIQFPSRASKGRATRSKNMRGQEVLISPRASAFLRQLSTLESGCYFSRDSVTVSVAIKRIRDRLKLPPLSFHSLRHTLNSELHDQGLSLEERAAVLGHLTVEVNNLYTHVDRQRIRGGLANLSALPFPAPDKPDPQS